MIKKLRRKFIIIVTFIVFGVLSCILGAINIINYNRIDNDSNGILQILEENGGNIPMPPFASVDNPIAGFSPEMPFQTRYFTVSLVDGKIDEVNITKIAAISESDAKNYVEQLIKKDKTNGYFNDYKVGKIDDGNKEIYIFLDCSRDLLFVRSFFKTSIMIAFLAFVLIFILVYVFSALAVKPIAESYAKQKRFITDANHEIKTPLAIIGATNEVIEMQFGQNQWSEVINNQIVKLSALTEKLVFLSRMDEENASVSMGKFCLSNVVQEVSEQYIGVSKSINKSFNVQIQQDIDYVGDFSLIGQMVSLLLDNAFKYSTVNGSVDLSLVGNERKIKLTVSNTVDGLNNSDLSKLFDRFYRLEQSRNSQTGGSGIGLSIVKAIVSIHKGKIAVKCCDNRILFVVVL